MAVGFTNHTSGTGGGSSVNNPTGPVTPTAGAVQLLTIVVGRISTAAHVTSVTNNNGGTWVLVGSVVGWDASGYNSFYLYRAQVASPTAGTAIIVVDNLNASVAWSWDEATGVFDDHANNGAGAILNPATAHNTTGNPVVTLPAFSDAHNAAFGAFGNAAGFGTVGAAYTLGGTASDSIAGEVHSEYDLANNTTVNGTVGFGAWAIIGAEIKAAVSSHAQTLSVVQTQTATIPNRFIAHAQSLSALQTQTATIPTRLAAHGQILSAVQAQNPALTSASTFRRTLAAVGHQFPSINPNQTYLSVVQLQIPSIGTVYVPVPPPAPPAPSPTATPTIEIAFPSNPTAPPTWIDVTSDARVLTGVTTKRGRPLEYNRFSTGSMAIELDDRARAYDWENAAGAHYQQILPERRIRFRMTWNGTAYIVFDGYVDKYDGTYAVPNEAVVGVPASDVFKALAQLRLPGSMYELITGLNPATHLYRLDDSGQVAFDNGTGTPVASANAVGAVATASPAIIPFDGNRTCFQFDGLSGRLQSAVTVGAGAQSHPFTIEAWVLSSSLNASNLFWTVCALVASDGHIIWQLGSAGAGAPGIPFLAFEGRLATIQGTGRLDDTKLHHVAATFQGSSAIVYLDGVPIGPAFAASFVNSTGTQFLIGGGPNGVPLGSFWHGSIAEVALLDGTVLTPTQLLRRYHAGKDAMAGEDTGTRLGHVLDYLNVPSSDRAITTGTSTLGAYDIPSSAKALDYAFTLDDTERGQFYAGVNGSMASASTFAVVWRSRAEMVSAARTNTSQATFGDASNELQYSNIVLSLDETNIFNYAQVQRSGGIMQLARDAASKDDFFDKVYQKSGLLYADDNQAMDHANWAVQRYAQPLTRILALEVRPQADPNNLWPQVLGREIGDRITVNRRPPGGGSMISKDVIIEGVAHSFKAGLWVTTWQLSPVLAAGPAASVGYWILGDAVYSILGTTTRVGF
jgi:hypothetical protein